MKLRTQDAQPLYKQIVQAIQHSIQSGEYPEGSRLPSEQELSELFHVSRITVRTALKELADEELVIRGREKAPTLEKRNLNAICLW